MRIAYLYNEILPTRKAHDAYVWRNCAALAAAGADVTLACGMGSPQAEVLAAHYATAAPASLRVRRLPILRRNWGLPFTWNHVFNRAAQRFIGRETPQVVLLSVRKQGAYHLARKRAGVRYVYEVHELEWYPTLGDADARHERVAREREMLARADLVTVTTHALARILAAPPYALLAPVAVVPLAIAAAAPPAAIAHALPLHVMYIGQLYAGQGVEDLVDAVVAVPGTRLTIVGGAADDVRKMEGRIPASARARVRLTGFVPPGTIPALAASAHVLAAPFRAERRMPFVAHTKLAEYVALRRPVIAPDLPIVHEHFPTGRGVLTFAAGDAQALAAALQQLCKAEAWRLLYESAGEHAAITWEARSKAYAALLRDTAT